MNRDQINADSASPQNSGHRWWIHAQNALTLGSIVLGPSWPGAFALPGQVLLGAFILTIGGVIGILGVRALGTNRTPHPVPLANGVLVLTGIFTRIRHPLYTSLILVTLAWSMIWGSFAALLASIALTLLLDRKARLEERFLAARFPGYIEYSNRVRRFIPGVY
jgi:protein-S-isoprenylcysteine O-methyltransferase Ste14